MRAHTGKWLLLFVLGVILSFSATIYAQGRRMDVDTRVNYLKEKLSLSDKQTAEVKKILVAQQEQAQKERAELMGNREEMRKNMMTRAQETDKKITALLDNKQKEEYKKIVQEREERWGQRR
ncbi:MAG: hypothetical protein ACM34K_15565 [Bacillota bacterium]